MNLDREKISDVFDDPRAIAEEIHRQASFGFKPTPIEEIAKELGIFKISEEPLSAIEGVLVVPEGKFEGEIRINQNINPRRKIFTIAHELGHYLHPFHHPKNGRYECARTDMFIDTQKSENEKEEQEAEANLFASEILIPTGHVKNNFSDLESINLNSMVNFADTLNVSKAAAFRKIHDNIKSEFAIIFSLDGKVKYLHVDNFPYLKTWYKRPLPSGC